MKNTPSQKKEPVSVLILASTFYQPTPMNNPHGNFFLSLFLFLAFWCSKIRAKEQQKGSQSKKRQIDNIDINSYTTQSFSYLGFLSQFHFFVFYFPSFFPSFFPGFPLLVLYGPKKKQKKNTALKNQPTESGSG